MDFAKYSSKTERQQSRGLTAIHTERQVDGFAYDELPPGRFQVWGAGIGGIPGNLDKGFLKRSQLKKQERNSTELFEEEKRGNVLTHQIVNYLVAKRGAGSPGGQCMKARKGENRGLWKAGSSKQKD